MKILIDARMYGAKQGGLGRYTEELIKELEKQVTSDNFVILLNKENWDDYKPKNKNFKKILANIPWYSLKEQTQLPGIIKKEHPDLVHFPHWNIPLLYRQPFLVTIHDLILIHYPDRRASTLSPIKYFFKYLMFKIILRHALKKSRGIITPSNFTKQDIIKTYNIPEKKITSIHLAPKNKIANRSEEQKKQTLEKYKIIKPFILYVGSAYPHKNLENLIKAWELFSDQYSKNYQLVLSGKKDYFYKRLEKEMNTKNIIFTDFTSNEEQADLYSQASLYIFPSLYEGFGLPPLEAMTYNTPVASSEASCLPEILRDACFYFNPHNLEEIAKTINLSLTDIKKRQEKQEKAQELLKKYSGKKTTTSTLVVYKNMI